MIYELWEHIDNWFCHWLFDGIVPKEYESAWDTVLRAIEELKQYIGKELAPGFDNCMAAISKFVEEIPDEVRWEKQSETTY